MNLREYVERFGEDRVAAELTEKLGRPITPHGVLGQSARKKPPKAWAEALGVDDGGTADSHSPAAPPDSEPDTPGEGPARRTEVPPRKPAEAAFAAPPVYLNTIAKERLVQIHKFAGGSVAMAADAKGFQEGTGAGGGIAQLWSDKAEPIADAWIAWANEGNKFAQSVVRTLSVGGAGGELVMGYLMLLGGTAYVLGHLPDNGITNGIYGRYSQYRVVVPEPADSSGQENGQRPGADPFGAGDLLVEPPGAAGV